MRRLVVTLVALAGVFASPSAFARKKIVIRQPAIVRACPRPSSWNDLTACLTKHGWVTREERTLGKAKLLRLDIPNGEKRVDPILALFVDDSTGLHVGGLYDLPSDDPSERSFVLGAQRLTVKNHTGYQIDLGEEHPLRVSLDDVSSLPSVQLVRHSLYCSGDSWSCTDIITACDTFVEGKAYWTFRGTVTIKDNMIIVDGNRQVAGTCAPTPSQFLGWPTGP